MAMYIVKPWYRKKDDAIYGAEWAGTSSPAWTRTDAAVGFSDPNPYYAGMSTTPSSPFDNIMPWSGIRRVTDANAGELVAYPKFYCKWTRNGVKMKLQISMTKHDGFFCSPAHADRGDGVGERDYVYVGRYACASDYKSKSGVTPKINTTRQTFRSGIHNLGTKYWQWDIAVFETIKMLYLVEYANWDCKSKISKGCCTSSPAQATGGTDNMPYHTGTMASSRSTYTNYMQYRWIEGLWSNVENHVDGITGGSNGFGSGGVYIIKNPANFDESTTNATYIGTPSFGSIASGNIISFIAPASGYDWVLFPNSVGSASSFTTYACASCRMQTGSTYGKIYIGGGGSQYEGFSLFNVGADIRSNYTAGSIGSRLMYLP